VSRSSPEIHGSCSRRFLDLRDAFAENFREREELGAAICVTIDARPVVDIWAGWTEQTRTQPWTGETLVDVFSVGKGMVALSLLVLIERGKVDLDAPVASYWPEFAALGKASITVRTLLAHRGGLPAIRRPIAEPAIYDWRLMTSALAEQKPWWAPGERHGYHVNTFGFLIGEIVRRVSGQTLGGFFRAEIAAPLEADFHFGIDAAEESRVAQFVWSPAQAGSEGGGVGALLAADDPHHAELLRCTYLNPPGLSGLGTVNTRSWRAAEIPSANAHANARATARLYAALANEGTANGVQILSPELVREARAEMSSGIDFVLRRPTRFGLGFQLTQPERPLGPNPNSFGHFGAGGSLGFADPDARLSFAYTPNRAGPGWQDPRNRALIDAAYRCL
jgi:CubicO group peptidase (beta-lactamase class C family)